MTKRLEDVSKKLALAQQREEKQKVECYICLSKMKRPLQICESGHFACADCICKQMKAENNLHRNITNGESIPVFTYSWIVKFSCGLCKHPANPKYAGALVTQLIDPDPILTCPACNQLYSESLIGMHIAFCAHNTTKCPLCEESCKILFINDHIRHRCLKIKCKKCVFTSNFVKMKQHMVQHNLVDRVLTSLPLLLRIMSHNIGMNRFYALLPIIIAFNNLLKSEDSITEDCPTICEEMKKLLTELGM
jgi:hypothetical protein